MSARTTDLNTWPRERLLAALALPTNSAPDVQAALRRALDRQGHSTPPASASVSQGATGAAGRGKRRGEPNATEARFAREVLDPMVLRGELDTYECEGMTLRIAGVGAITPDFCGWLNGVPVLFEVKGERFIHEATVLRTKVHASARPWLRWRIYARADGSWKVRFDSRGVSPLADVGMAT